MRWALLAALCLALPARGAPQVYIRPALNPGSKRGVYFPPGEKRFGVYFPANTRAEALPRFLWKRGGGGAVDRRDTDCDELFQSLSEELESVLNGGDSAFSRLMRVLSLVLSRPVRPTRFCLRQALDFP